MESDGKTKGMNHPFSQLFRPWMRQAKGGVAGIVVVAAASVGLTLATVAFSASTTTAFPMPLVIADALGTRRRSERSFAGITRCEELSSSVQETAVAAADGHDDSSSAPLHSTALSQQLSNNQQQYERLNSPARLDLHTHAVSGLFCPQKIARYEIYKRLKPTEVAPAPDDAAASASPNQEQHLITALVDFGDSLDGHPGVVHGGILSLVLDDIFGFAFGALGVPFAVTANLSVDYRAPTPANTSVVVKVFLDRPSHETNQRKLYFKGEITSLDGSILYVESTCLYIIPRAVWERMAGNEEAAAAS